MAEAAAVATQFNDAINARDLTTLTELMADDHRFVDTAGGVIVGKKACVEAWRSFFAAFPTYRNIWATVQTNDHGVVVAGHSTCQEHPELQGPALWRVLVKRAQVSEWQVHSDTPKARRQLGLASMSPPGGGVTGTA
jgi:ketosteroid isomerase-like protein